MDVLALDPRGYSGTYKLIGGRPSLDFVNTVSYPESNDPHDWLAWAPNVVQWATALRLIRDSEADVLYARISGSPRVAGKDLARLQRVRGVIADVLTPAASGQSPFPDALARLNGQLQRAVVHRTVDPASLDWCWSPATRLDDVARPVILDAALLVVEGDPSRLGRCPACRWLYYDASRNRSRKWCDMADCGSRDKALRYYHRKRRRSEG